MIVLCLKTQDKQTGGRRGKWRRHSLEFRKPAVEKMKTSSNLHELAREPGIERKLLWRPDSGVRIRTSRRFWEKKRRKWIFSPLPCAE